MQIYIKIILRGTVAKWLRRGSATSITHRLNIKKHFPKVRDFFIDFSQFNFC